MLAQLERIRGEGAVAVALPQRRREKRGLGLQRGVADLVGLRIGRSLQVIAGQTGLFPQQIRVFKTRVKMRAFLHHYEQCLISSVTTYQPNCLASNVPETNRG